MGSMGPAGMGFGASTNPAFTETSEVDALKAEEHKLEQQLRAINERISQLEITKEPRRRFAAVDAAKCAGCGICEQVCPTGAISVGTVARVDTLKCMGCGLCTTQCPQGALNLEEV